MFVSLRRAAQELQDEELFSLGLNAMGAQDITREELEVYSADIFKACEYVNSSIDTDRLIFWHLSPDKRQYWREGIQWLIDNGFCREAIWSLITLAPACLVEMQEAGLESEVSHGCISFLRRLGFAPFGDAQEKLDILQTWMQRTQWIIDQIA